MEALGDAHIVIGLLVIVALFNVLAAILYVRRDPSFLYPASSIGLGAIWVILTAEQMFTAGAGVEMFIVWMAAAAVRRAREHPLITYDGEVAQRAVLPTIVAFAISVFVAGFAVAIASAADIL